MQESVRFCVLEAFASDAMVVAVAVSKTHVSASCVCTLRRGRDPCNCPHFVAPEKSQTVTSVAGIDRSQTVTVLTPLSSFSLIILRGGGFPSSRLSHKMAMKGGFVEGRNMSQQRMSCNTILRCGADRLSSDKRSSEEVMRRVPERKEVFARGCSNRLEMLARR